MESSELKILRTDFYPCPQEFLTPLHMRTSPLESAGPGSACLFEIAWFTSTEFAHAGREKMYSP